MLETARQDHAVVELSRSDLALVRAALRLMLRSEDDPDTIRELKALLARFQASADED